MTESLFIELLQTALGLRQILCKEPSDKEWADLYDMCGKQAVVGFAFLGVKALQKEGYKIPQSLLFEWIGNNNLIESRNCQLNQQVVEVSEYFKKAGFQTCLLKGQGNAQMYSNTLSRMPGDIDLWVSGGKDKVCQFVKQRYPNAKECGWHIDYPIFSDVPVEIHFKPGYARLPKYDKRLQDYFEKNAEPQFGHHIHLYKTEGTVSVPTFEFNVVLQLSHIMRHFMIEGIGMRHIIDIYYLLTNSENQQSNHADLNELLRYLGLARFASAVMWIMKDVFFLDETRLICKSNRERGKLLLDEILNGGNFGRYDKRKTGMLASLWGFYPFASRALRLVWLFPEEAIITPLCRRIRIIN